MVNQIYKDIFIIKRSHPNALMINQTAVETGQSGALIMAYNVTRQYRESEKEYVEYLKTLAEKITKPGDIDVYENRIVTFAIKNKNYHKATIQEVEAGLLKVKEYMKANNIKKVLTPVLGSFDGLKSNNVLKLINNIFGKEDIECIVSYTSNVAKETD